MAYIAYIAYIAYMAYIANIAYIAYTTGRADLKLVCATQLLSYYLVLFWEHLS